MPLTPRVFAVLGLSWVVLAIGCSSSTAQVSSPESPLPPPEAEVTLPGDDEPQVIGQQLQTVSFPAIADAEVREAEPSTHFGSRTVVQSDGAPLRWGYLKFNLAGLSRKITRAVIRCTVVNTTGNGPAVHRTSSSWDEGTLTWSNKPGYAATALDDLAAVTTNAEAVFDVTDAVTGNGAYAFVLIPTSSDALACASRESGNGPKLWVTHEPTFYDVGITHLSLTPTAPTAGQPVVFSATVKNLGSVSTPSTLPVRVDFLLDGSGSAVGTAQTAGGLAPGASVVLSGPVGPGWTAIAGAHTVTAILDPMNALTKDDRTNNSATGSFNVASQVGYDLVVSDVRWLPSAPLPGQSVTFSATLKNQGSAATPSGVAHSVQFRLDGSTTAAAWPKAPPTVSLAPGESVEVTGDGGGWVAIAGVHSVVAVADPGNLLPAELTEQNNQRSESFTVGSGTDPGGACKRDLLLPGDSHPCTTIVYPTAAIASATNPLGRVLDVTDFGADGSDDVDDSAAFIRVYDRIMAELKAVGWNGFFQKNNKASFIVYIPDGVYKVSRSLVYSGAIAYVPSADGTPIRTAEASVQLRFIGQSRENTILELASGTFATTPGAVLAFGRTDFNNTPASNALRNLTIRIKPNNALATGVYFGGANSADIENVAVIAEDGRGFVGIDNRIGTVVGPQRHITIQGFDYGFRMEPYHFTHPVLEHITLQGQRLAGIALVNGTASMRAVHSTNTVPAVLLSDSGAHGVLFDSTLTGGAAGESAVKVLGGSHFFGRDLTVTGYGCGLQKGSACAVGANVSETVSDGPIARSATRPANPKSLSLPVAEPPHSAWGLPDSTQWVMPVYSLTEADNAVDATARIQAAVNSGKPVVYFPAHAYQVNGTVLVPCSVKRLEGLFTEWVGSGNPKLKVAANCPEPLVVTDFSINMNGGGGGTFVSQASLRTLVLSHIHSQSFVYDNEVLPSTGTPTLFAYMVGNLKAGKPFRNVRAYLRMASGESPQGTYLVDGPTTQVWLMGFKTEKAQASFRVQGGATLEVLGGILNQYSQEAVSSWSDADAIALSIDGASSRVSFVACTNGPSASASGDGFRTLIKDSTLSTVATWSWTDLPVREGRDHQEVIPLYVSY
jgi:hypothetical protein